VAYRLSVVMIAKDAADLLPDCLASVAFADEIILLDSGSRDATLEIAQAAGAKTFTNTEWRGYGLQRQLAQRYASGDYVLMIDTDERVTAELASAIQETLKAPQPNTVYSIARRNLFLGRFMRHSGWYPDRVIRFYAREQYQYNDNQVHESLNTAGARTLTLKGDLLHLTCRDFASFQRKQLNYATTWAHERHQQGKHVSFMAIFSHTLGAFFKTLILRAGFLDGKQGLLLAVVNAQYTFNKYTELWALNHQYTKQE